MLALPNTAVRFESVSKKFTRTRNRPSTVQEIFLRLFGAGREQSREEFWALRDVNLEIHPGETIGFLGVNGAGKSTLLKLTSRIIFPTTGTITANGRVASLLEVGTGFHPDLTGRENIHLNGSLLGMSRAEVKSKLDDIIEFAELKDFIDMPVKHYSSGMYMRLGFSVAAHVDPDILLVDEVLAVGDEAFQQKCQRRVEQLGKEGVTILFVSHDLEAVRRICQRAVWLDGGRICIDGPVEQVTDTYAGHLAAHVAEDSSMGALVDGR